MHIIQKSNSFCFLNIKKREKKNHTNSESSWLGDARSRDELPRPVPNPRAAGFFLSLLKMTLKKICKSHFLFKKMQPVVFFTRECCSWNGASARVYLQQCSTCLQSAPLGTAHVLEYSSESSTKRWWFLFAVLQPQP